MIEGRVSEFLSDGPTLPADEYTQGGKAAGSTPDEAAAEVRRLHGTLGLEASPDA